MIFLLHITYLSNAQIGDSVIVNQLISKSQSLLNVKPDSSLILAKQAKSLAQKIKFTAGIARSLKIESNNYYFKGQHDVAVKLYLDALKQFELINDKKGIGEIYNELGTLWKKQGDIEKSKTYFNDALKIFEQLNDQGEIASTLNNIGITYEMEGNPNEALKYYTQSLEINRRENNELAASYSLANLGGVYTSLKNYKEAENVLLESIKIRKKLGENQNVAICLTNLGELYSAQNKFEKAIDLFSQSLVIAKQTSFVDLIQYDYEKLSDAYSAIGDFKKAYNAHKEYLTFKDSLFNEIKNKQIAELQTKYDTEKKEQQNKLLQKENQINEFSLRKAKFQNYALTGFLMLVIVIAYLFYNRNKIKQQKILTEELLKQEQLRLRSVILTQEVERKRISQELHDGLGQMLSAVKLNLASIENTPDENESQLNKAIILIDDSCKELRSISHNMMPAILIKSGLVPALKEIACRINNASVLEVLIDDDDSIKRLDDTVEVNLFRIIQELLNNIIKYACATEVHIQLSTDAGKLCIMIEDNGKGFDKKLIETSSGNGWFNINSRINLLNAKIEIDSNIGSGTVVFIDMPLDKIVIS